MTSEQMVKAMGEIVEFYKLIEQQYGINLTEEVKRAKQVKEDIPEAIWKAESMI